MVIFSEGILLQAETSNRPEQTIPIQEFRISYHFNTHTLSFNCNINMAIGVTRLTDQD